MVYHWYLHGDGQNGPLSIRAVAMRLTEMHIPTRGDKQKHYFKKQGAGIWQHGMVRHILTNETYTGVWHYGKTEMVSDGKEALRKPKSKCGPGKQVARSRDEWVGVEVPAIIHKEEFEQVKKRFQQNIEQSQRNGKRQYLLGRRLRCARCGYTYAGRTRNEKNQYYYCNGRMQNPPMCDMPTVRADIVDDTVWQWVKRILMDPPSLAEGLRASQSENQQTNQALQERLALIDAQLTDTQCQLTKLLDLYLDGAFPKEVLTERKMRLETTIAELTRERDDIDTHIRSVAVTDEQIAEIEAFCAEVRVGLENATFEDKRRYFDLLDVHGKLAVENDERVIYITCLIGKQRLVQMQTSPSSNTGATATMPYACR